MKKIICLCLCALMLLPTIISCNRICPHKFSQGECKICGEKCTHTFENEICSTCEYKCPHSSYDKGVCVTCNTVHLTSADLPGRTFHYAYFEVQWSENATETQKEILRKRFNKSTDQEVFDKIHEENLDVVKYFGSSVGMIDRYEFPQKSLGLICIRYKNGKYSTMPIECYGNQIKLEGQNLYYEKDRIYSIDNSTDYEGISIKTFFVEK